MGGKPNPGTKKDMRLAANKPKAAPKPLILPKSKVQAKPNKAQGKTIYRDTD